MLELFPEGFEEVDRPQGVELAAYTDAAGEERLWAFFGGARAADVEGGWEDKWRAFHRPVARRPAVGRPAVGAAGRRRARRRDRPGPRVRHRLAPDDAALPRARSRSSSPARCSTSAAAPACSRSRPRCSGFAPVRRRRRRGAVGRGDARERGGERRRRRGAAASARGRAAAAGGRRRREHLPRVGRGATARRIDCAHARHLGLSRSRARRRSPASSTSRGGRSTAGRATSTAARKRIRSRADGDVLGRLPRLQGLARRRARGARSAASRRPRGGAATRRRRGDQHLLRHERGASRRAARRPRARHARTRACTSPAAARTSQGDAFAGLPANVVVVAKRARGDGCVRRRRRRRDRLRPGRRADRPRARVREDPGRLLVLVQLLRHPARARRVPQPQRRRGARRDPAPRRAGAPRGRSHRHQPRLLPRSRRRATTCRGSSARRGRRRGSSGCASARSRSTTSNDALVAALRETPTVSRHLHVPLQSGDDGVLRAMRRRYTRRHLPPPARAARRRVQPDERRHRRVSGRGRGGVRDDARDRRARRDHEGARLPVLAAARHASPRPTTPCRRR